jgi:hypothetical protein
VTRRTGKLPPETASKLSVNRLVAGSNPARGASFFNSLPQTFPVLCVQNARPFKAQSALARATMRGRAELLTDAEAPAGPRKTQTSKRQDNTFGARLGGDALDVRIPSLPERLTALKTCQRIA